MLLLIAKTKAKERILIHFQDGYAAEGRSEVRILRIWRNCKSHLGSFLFSLASSAINLIIKITFFVGRGGGGTSLAL